jgi:hypothetical protein
MKRNVLAAALLMVFVAAPAGAQIEKPIRWTWITTSCETWNCAAAALVLANGDKHVIVLPTGNDERPWLILKRVEEGSIYIPADEPYGCEVFANVTDAGSRFTAMDGCHGPMMLNVPDGRAVVLSLHECGDQSKKRRAMR